jgi:mono/diheme cytochrome c family protein
MNKIHPLVEFGIVLLLIAAAITFAWNVDFSFRGKDTSEKKDSAPKNAVASNSPEYQNWKQGKDLFKSNCAACHNPKADGTGPVLTGVTARWNAAGEYAGKSGKQWLYSWIRNWNDPINAGYKYAIEMANSRPAQMNMFPLLKDEEIDLLLYYLENPDGPQDTVVKTQKNK